MQPPPTILAVFSPWKRFARPGFGRPPHAALQADLRRTIAAVSRCPTRISRHHDLVLADLLDVPGLLAALDVACRGEAWTCGVCLRPLSNPRFAAPRVSELARRTPWGLAIRRDHFDPAVAPVAAALALHVTALRRRNTTQWQALDAVREHGNCTAAARALGISHQAVSKQVRSSNARATDLTAGLLQTILASDRQPSRERLGVATS